jgi:hypothetical protein
MKGDFRSIKKDDWPKESILFARTTRTMPSSTAVEYCIFNQTSFVLSNFIVRLVNDYLDSEQSGAWCAPPRFRGHE